MFVCHLFVVYSDLIIFYLVLLSIMLLTDTSACWQLTYHFPDLVQHKTLPFDWHCDKFSAVFLKWLPTLWNKKELNKMKGTRKTKSLCWPFSFQQSIILHFYHFVFYNTYAGLKNILGPSSCKNFFSYLELHNISLCTGIIESPERKGIK